MKTQHTIATGIAFALTRLQSISSTPKLDAELLLASVIDQPRSYLYAHANDALTDEILTRFEAYLQRRERGEPIAYILGEQEFYSLSFIVNPSVLIPRPETELLVDTVVKHVAATPHTIADFGTGSGAIAVALAHAKPNWRVFALDTSPEALTLAEQNAKRNEVNIETKQSDWGQALADHSVDVIVSNPPYIDQTDTERMSIETKFEPREALFADNHGLAAFEAIIKESKRVLTPKGQLFFEHGIGQADHLTELLVENGFDREAIESINDLAGIARVIHARNPNS